MSYKNSQTNIKRIFLISLISVLFIYLVYARSSGAGTTPSIEPSQIDCFEIIGNDCIKITINNTICPDNTYSNIEDCTNKLKKNIKEEITETIEKIKEIEKEHKDTLLVILIFLFIISMIGLIIQDYRRQKHVKRNY